MSAAKNRPTISHTLFPKCLVACELRLGIAAPCAGTSGGFTHRNAPGESYILQYVSKSKAGDDAYIVALDGHLDIYRVPEVRRALQAGSSRRRLIIDLSRVRSLSAAILTELVRSYKQRLARGLEPARLVVQSLSVRKVLEITGLTKIWHLFESVEAASIP